jgi:hypothetical protein
VCVCVCVFSQNMCWQKGAAQVDRAASKARRSGEREQEGDAPLGFCLLRCRNALIADQQEREEFARERESHTEQRAAQLERSQAGLESDMSMLTSNRDSIKSIVEKVLGGCWVC